MEETAKVGLLNMYMTADVYDNAGIKVIHIHLLLSFRNFTFDNSYPIIPQLNKKMLISSNIKVDKWFKTRIGYDKVA